MTLQELEKLITDCPFLTAENKAVYIESARTADPEQLEQMATIVREEEDNFLKSVEEKKIADSKATQEAVAKRMTELKQQAAVAQASDEMKAKEILDSLFL